MNRSSKRSLPSTALVLSLCLGAAGLAALTPASSLAQATARVRPRGDVTGVEVTLEGGLTARRGGSLRWLITTYEVTGTHALRLAPGAQVRLSSSLQGAEDVEVVADARGRALIELPIPLDAPAGVGVVVEVRTANQVQRRFEVGIGIEETRGLNVGLIPRNAAPGDTVHAVILVTEPHSQVGVPNGDVRVELRDQRGPLGEPQRVRTDLAGLALVPLTIPDNAQPGQLTVSVSHFEPSETGPRVTLGSASMTLERPRVGPLHVAILPARVLANSEERIPVEVVVRRANGRPVAGAVLRHNGERRDEDAPPLTTDSRGRASFVWRAPRINGGVSDQSVSVQVTRAGLGSASAETRIRAHAQDFFVDAAFEGGAISAALGGRIYAYVVRADGRPAANVPVSFEGPRVGTLSATTDASGLAFAEATLAAPDEATDRCGGIASTALRVAAGSGARAGSHEVCMPVDTDSHVRVRAPSIVTPGPVTLSLARAASAARVPVVVTAFAAAHRDGGPLEALGSVVTDTAEAQLVLPADVPQQVYFRARPLVDGREVRGSFAASWVRRSDALTPVVRFDPAGRALVSGLPTGTPFVTLAMPADEARALYAEAHQHANMMAVSALEAEARLARAVPVDSAAPVRQQGSSLVPQPMPEDAVQRGLLRDPWRASSRFIEGRLALLFRQVEARVESALPNDLDDITVVTNGRREFTRQVFATLAGEATTGLGGEPLALADVQALDSSFGFDNTARRITRRRLFRLLVVLRDLVRDNGLDLPWARPGDPAEWLSHLPGRSGAVGYLQPADLVDGWGRPFRLTATTRPRYTQLQPVAGYELSSAGPDGRTGNGDDLVDPTARVLPSDGLYARAVGEDALVARLQSVELGRATVELASQPVGIETPYIPEPSDLPGGRGSVSMVSEGWSVPTVIERDVHALDLRWRGVGTHSSGASSVASAGTTSVPLSLSDVPATWGVLVIARDTHGTMAVAMDEGLAGTPIVAEALLPARVRVGEPLSVPMHVTNTSDADATYGLAASAGDGLSVSLPANVTVPAGESRELALVLNGRAPGDALLRVQVTRDGQPQRSLEARVAVDRGRHPIRRWGTGVARADQYSVSVQVPSDAVDPRTRVVLLTPGALAGDPILNEVRERQPGAMAWSAVSAGRGVPAELRAALVRQDTEEAVPLAEHAARVVALTSVVALDPLDHEALSALRRAQSQLSRNVGRLDSREQAVQVATAFTVLAAGGVPDEDSADPTAAFMSSARVALRRALFVHRGDAGVLARVAAALLVADPEDGYGIALFDRALASTTERDGHRRVTLDELLAEGSEATGAGLALALAAHHVGRDGTRDELIRGAMQTFGSVARDPDDALLYWFALSAYGALGVGEPEGLEVNVGSGWQPVTLEEGRAIIDVNLDPGERLHAKVRTTGGAAVYARVETVFGAAFEEREDAPFTLSIDGDMGRMGGVAGLVLEVQAGDQAVMQPVIELQLPAGVPADEALEAALAAPAVVLTAEVRRPGFVRLTLAPLNAEQRHSVPLAFVWTSLSPVRGLGAAGYDASHPTRMTVLPPRVLTPSAPEGGALP